MEETWSESIVDRLAALKLIAGMEHESAWAIAVREIPPRGREHRGELTLLTPRGEVDAVEFLRRATADAWYGRAPALAALTADTVDRALSARRLSRSAPLSESVRLMRRCPIHPWALAEDCQRCERRGEELEAARAEPDEDRVRIVEDRYEAWLESCWP